MRAGLRKDDSMYSIDWTTGTGRIEFLTFGLSEEHLPLVSYDVEIGESARLLFDANSEGKLARLPPAVRARTLAMHDANSEGKLARLPPALYWRRHGKWQAPVAAACAILAYPCMATCAWPFAGILTGLQTPRRQASWSKRSTRLRRAMTAAPRLLARRERWRKTG